MPALASEADHPAGSQIAKHEGVSGAPPAPGTPGGSTDRGSRERVHGIDVSSHQGNVNWTTVAAKGARFAYVKATEGTGYKNPYFVQQYEGSYYAGLVHGAYHFALPDRSDGGTQADFFVDHGGGWSPDGRTLPPALDIEYNPYGDICYGMDDEEMADWIREFSDQVHERTGRWPTIYTSTNWWNQCVGGSGRFGTTNPLWIARYASSVGALPFDWEFHTIWQYANAGAVPGDQNYFNGSYDRLIALANG
ncbi:lysozyme [Goodfellowiella coeruleoviolacea]|nr:lysozyme [Goodfellowiella coeruleoviolacea]